MAEPSDDGIPAPPPGWGGGEVWPEPPTLFDRLAIGDIVEHRTSGERWEVVHIGWNTVTVKRLKILRRPDRWRLVAKAPTTDPRPEPPGH